MSNSFPSSDSIFGFAWLQLDPFNRSLSGGGQQEHQKCLAKVCLGWLTSFLSSSPSLKKTRTMTAITTPTHLHSSLFVHRLSLFFNGPECYFFVFLSGRFFFSFYCSILLIVSSSPRVRSLWQSRMWKSEPKAKRPIPVLLPTGWPFFQDTELPINRHGWYISHAQ